jgi:hypothetical protein
MRSLNIEELNEVQGVAYLLSGLTSWVMPCPTCTCCMRRPKKLSSSPQAMALWTPVDTTPWATILAVEPTKR